VAIFPIHYYIALLILIRYSKCRKKRLSLEYDWLSVLDWW